MEYTNSSTFTNIYINNIDKSVTEDELRYLCSYNGRKVRSIVLITDESGVSKGYGFCNFETHEDAVKAIEMLNILHVGPKKITASPATSRLEREKFLNSVHKTHSPNENPHVYIKNLDYAVMEEDLRRLFCKFGRIINVRIIRNKVGQSKGFGFVSFDNFLDAQRAISSLNGIKLGKLCISMDFYESKESRSARFCETDQYLLPSQSVNINASEKKKINSGENTVLFNNFCHCSTDFATPGPSYLTGKRFSIELYAGPGLLNDEREVKMLFYDFPEDKYVVKPVLNHRNIFVNKWIIYFCLKDDMKRALAIAEHLYVKGRRVTVNVVDAPTTTASIDSDVKCGEEHEVKEINDFDEETLLPSPDIFDNDDETKGNVKLELKHEEETFFARRNITLAKYSMLF